MELSSVADVDVANMHKFTVCCQCNNSTRLHMARMQHCCAPVQCEDDLLKSCKRTRLSVLCRWMVAATSAWTETMSLHDNNKSSLVLPMMSLLCQENHTRLPSLF